MTKLTDKCIVCDQNAISSVKGFDLCGEHYTAVIQAEEEKAKKEKGFKRIKDREEFKNLYPHIKLGPR